MNFIQNFIDWYKYAFKRTGAWDTRIQSPYKCPKWGSRKGSIFHFDAGWHRIVKAVIKEYRTIKAVQLTKDLERKLK